MSTEKTEEKKRPPCPKCGGHLDEGSGLLSMFGMKNWRCKPCWLVMVAWDPDGLYFDRSNSPNQDIGAALRARANEIAIAAEMKSKVNDIVSTPIEDRRWQAYPPGLISIGGKPTAMGELQSVADPVTMVKERLIAANDGANPAAADQVAAMRERITGSHGP